MRSILVLNPKGGCGKSTIATNTAGYFASQGKRVSIADCDPQQFSSDWLSLRPESVNPIKKAVVKAGKIDVPRRTEILIIDTPAALHGKKLANYAKISQTIVMPMMPSPLDIRAAERFVEELFSLRKLINRKIKIATVANRVREDTIAAAKLENYLDKIKLPTGHKLPFITMLRATQNYIKAAERGLSIFEFAPAKTTYDREQWQPLLKWLKSVRSMPD